MQSLSNLSKEEGGISFDKNLLIDDVQEIFASGFDIALGKAIGEMYTISDLLDILNYKTGEEREWISKIDECLEKIEVLDEFEKYIIQMERLREIVRMYLCMFLIIPKGIELIRSAFAYMLIVLQYGGIESLSELSRYSKNEQETGEEDFFVTVYDRVVATISYLAIKLFTQQAMQFVSGSEIKPVEWSPEEDANVNNRGLPTLDCGAWRDFNEYLSDTGLFLPDVTRPKICSVM